MKTVTVSAKYQIVIPRELCRLLNIYAGQKLKARIQGDHIKLEPILPLTAARRFLPGLDTKVSREPSALRAPAAPQAKR